MKAVAALVNGFGQEEINAIESTGSLQIELEGETVSITVDDVEISTSDLPGWSVASEGDLTLALDITLTEALKMEGIARELVSKVQQLRKGEGYEVTDRIALRVRRNGNVLFERSIETHAEHILEETLSNTPANALLVDELNGGSHEIELAEGLSCNLYLSKEQG